MVPYIKKLPPQIKTITVLPIDLHKNSPSKGSKIDLQSRMTQTFHYCLLEYSSDTLWKVPYKVSITNRIASHLIICSSQPPLEQSIKSIVKRLRCFTLQDFLDMPYSWFQVQTSFGESIRFFIPFYVYMMKINDVKNNFIILYLIKMGLNRNISRLLTPCVATETSTYGAKFSLSSSFGQLREVANVTSPNPFTF